MLIITSMSLYKRVSSLKYPSPGVFRMLQFGIAIVIHFSSVVPTVCTDIEQL